jgi:MSHA biogenesis protein MshN
MSTINKMLRDLKQRGERLETNVMAHPAYPDLIDQPLTEQRVRWIAWRPLQFIILVVFLGVFVFVFIPQPQQQLDALLRTMQSVLPFSVIEPTPRVEAPVPVPSVSAVSPSEALSPAISSDIAPPRDDLASVPASTATPTHVSEAPVLTAPPGHAAPAEPRPSESRVVPPRPSTSGRARVAPPRQEQTSGVLTDLPSAPGSIQIHALPSVSSSTSATAGSTKPDLQIVRRDASAGSSALEKADQDVQRARSLLQRGRVAEAAELLHAVLTQEPMHQGARQLLVAHLLETQRLDEAMQLLRESLSMDAKRHADAMLLARLLVQKKDVNAALTVLQRHAVGAETNAGYRAFHAALLQRVGRHDMAITEYRHALEVSESNALWWVGLGVSLESTERMAQAADAFRRAKAIGNLPTETAVYVEQRLRHLP